MDTITYSILVDLIRASARIFATASISGSVCTSQSTGFALAAHTALGWSTDGRPTDLRFRQACLQAALASPCPLPSEGEVRERWVDGYADAVLVLLGED